MLGNRNIHGVDASEKMYWAFENFRCDDTISVVTTPSVHYIAVSFFFFFGGEGRGR